MLERLELLCSLDKAGKSESGDGEGGVEVNVGGFGRVMLRLDLCDMDSDGGCWDSVCVCGIDFGLGLSGLGSRWSGVGSWSTAALACNRCRSVVSLPSLQTKMSFVVSSTLDPSMFFVATNARPAIISRTRREW